MTRPVYWNNDALPYDGTLAHILYDIRRSDAGENLLMDAVTLQDIIEDSDGELSLDALVSPYARLERRMEILRGIMERTGDKVKPVAMQVTQPFKQRGVANVATIFELSDGQTASIYFHNPDTTPGKMTPTDEVISWKWLLNKKDITIVVAPERGADLNVREVARRIMRLAEKNSAAFQRANAKRAERMQGIENLKQEIAQLEAELKSAQNELEVAKLEWEEAQERAKAQKDIESDEDDDRPQTEEEKVAYLQRIRNSHTIGVADPNEPENNEEMRNINGVPTIVVNAPETGKAAHSAKTETLNPNEFTAPAKLYDEYLNEVGGNSFEAAKAFYKTELQGKVVKTVIGNVWMLGSTWQKVKLDAKKDISIAALVAYVPEILKSGNYEGKESLYKEREDEYVAFHHFTYDIQIGDKKITAGVGVGERADGQFEYVAYSLNHSLNASWKKRKTPQPQVLNLGREPSGEAFRTPESLTGREGFTTDSAIQLLQTPGYGPGTEDCGVDADSERITLQTLDAVNDDDDGYGWNIRILKVVDLKTGERLRELEDGGWEDEVGHAPQKFTAPAKLYDEYLNEVGGNSFEAAKAFYKTELQGKVVKTVIGDVHLTGGGFREMRRGMRSDEIKARLIAHVPEILSTGRYDGRTELHKPRSDSYVAFHFFSKEVGLGEAVVTAGVNVGERDDKTYTYTAYGLGHEHGVGWKNKAASGDVLDAALLREELFRGPGVPSEPTTKPGSTSSPLLTMDASITDDDDGWNIRILKVVDLKTGERLRELEDGDWGGEAENDQTGREQALIDAFIQSYADMAAQSNAAVAAVNWEGIVNSEAARAEASRLHATATANTDVAITAKKALLDAGISLYDKRVARHERPEYKAWEAANTTYREAMDQLLDIAKNRMIEEGKAELAALSDGAPVADVACAIYRKRGIDIGAKVPGIVAAIEAKNADAVWEWLRVLDNKASAEIFERATGTKLAKTRRDRRVQIDAWAEITPEQRAEQEAAQDAAWQDKKRQETLQRAWDVLANVQVRTKRDDDNTQKIVNGQEFLQWLLADGYDQIQASKKGAATFYTVHNGYQSTGINSKNFNGFVKAALIWGGLHAALKQLGVIAPQTEQADVERIAAVNAAYTFASATDNFKRWLHGSMNTVTSSSPFATAKAMDEAAKRHGATVEWDKTVPVLDDTGHSVASLQAGLAVVKGQASDSVTGIAAETAASIQQAIDALEDDDYAPVEEEFGGIFEAEAVTLDSAGDSPLKALLASLRSFLQQQPVLDAAGNDPGYVGKIKQGGEIVGRIDIGDDGNAVVYVGATGDKRVVLSSGVEAMWSDDNAVDMVDALFAMQEQAVAEPKTSAFGEIFYGYTNKPEAAIDKIMTEKRGEVPDAFVHPELGNIAFVYGNEQMGLRHIEVRHPEMLNRIPDVLRTGRVVRDEKGLPRSYVVQDGEPSSVATIRLDWDGEQKTWLVTAFTDDVGKFGAQKSPGELSKVISEQPTHPTTPFLGSPAVAGQGNSTTDADTLPERIPGTRAVAAKMDNADLWLLETLKELGDLTDEQAQVAAQYFIKHKLARRNIAMSRYEFKNGAYLERDAIRIVAGITDASTNVTTGKDEFTIGTVKLQAFTAKSNTGSRVWGVRVLENGKEINAANGDGSWFKHDTKASMIDSLERLYAAGMAHGDKVQNENQWREAFGLPPLDDEQPESTAMEQARTLFQSVIDGTAPDILAPELADEMEAAYLPVQGDPEIEELFERAVDAYQAAMLAATENLE